MMPMCVHWEYLKDFLGPGSEGLLLATQFVSLAHTEYALSSELLEQSVHSVGKCTEVWVGPRAKAKHRKPIRDVQKEKNTDTLKCGQALQLQGRVQRCYRRGIRT